MTKIVNFFRKHPIIANLLAAFVAGIILLWLLSTVFLNIWTRHNATTTVPDVKGMNITAAVSELLRGGYDVEVDSLHNERVAPGSVFEQSPHADALVKKGRTVYITYACYSPRPIRVPNYYGMSRRQAVSAFENAKITDITIREVPSEHADLVVAVKFNGIILQPGQEIPMGSGVIIEVGARPVGAESYDESNDDAETTYAEDADERYIQELENSLMN